MPPILIRQKMTFAPLIFCLIFTFFGLSPGTSQGSENYHQHFSEACRLWEVPPRLALAIAKQESGMNPWAINVAGRSFMLKTQEEALRLANFAWEKNYSFDVGLMQINSFWLSKFNLSPALVLEPQNNILLGVWILSQEIKRHGLTWRAVAGYHTPDPERGRRYAASVIRLMPMVELVP